ncbi:MAG: TonB-dependent receptor [Bacteroidales bacterium]|nr:TonB-dependent receptor [Bacteroidales bacterium]MCF8389229.1 TonB-dependent receptor [Bacteroidales bacterium]
MKILLFSIAFILLETFCVNAQNISVLNGSSHEPVSNVALYNSERNIATLSDANGIANISIFRENDSIFFQHPSFISIGLLKSDLSGRKRILLSKKIILIDEYVISATKSRENKKDVAYQIDVLDKLQLMYNTGQTAADILLSSGNLVIQKSQGGGGSPILRGMEANRVLLVVDGVRLNNAIYRSGHLQNSITLDNSILDRVEVTFGPTSLIYGSDALGGVIHYYTKEPVFSPDSLNYNFNAQAFTSYSSANSGKIAHFNMNNGFKNIAFLSSVSYKDLGDVRMGKFKNPFYGDFGEITHYVANVDNKDLTMENPDPYTQLNTGYSQLDLLQKIKYSPSRYYDWVFNFQFSSSSEIDRLDMLNDYSGDDLAYAEYYYGPQNRLLTSLKSVIKKDNALFTNMTSILAYQRIDEDRFTRKFDAAERMVQREDVDVYSLNIDLLKLINSQNRINYGLEVNHNSLGSSAYYENIINLDRGIADTRYPDGGSSTWSYSAYGNYKWFLNQKFIFSTGARYHYGQYHSDFLAEGMGALLPYSYIDINNGALTGSLSMVYSPGNNWKIQTIASTGFRNPNIDDYGKVRAKNNLVTVPNSDLKPEYSYNFELGFSKTIEGYIQLNATAYYTFLTDAIVRTDYSLNGSDSLEYDGDMYKIITNSNASSAYIRGISMNLISDLNSNLNFKSTLNFTQGLNKTENVPLGHIPPIFGRTTIKYKMKNNITEMFVDYNGWKKMEDINPFGEDNEEEATEYGWPGWYTLNLRTSFQLNELFLLQIAVENIFDNFYKPFASGIAGPGRNFIVTLRANIN